MKKTITILIAILIALYAVLAMLGRGGEYAAEKLFYQAMKINSKIAANPDVAPPALLASVENNLQKLLKKYPATNTAKSASMVLAEFYASNKQYDKALHEVDAILDKYAKNMAVASTAQFLKGIIYEKQNQWDRALKEFATLRDKYSNTQLGMQAPLYIAKYYELKGKKAEADQAYNDAAIFYEKAMKDDKGNPRGYIASTLLLQAYLNLERYEEAGSLAEETIKNYLSPMALNQFLPAIDFVYLQKLNKPDKAVEIYKFVKTKARDERLIKLIDKKIKAIEAKK